jgi:hypothetical protein
MRIGKIAMTLGALALTAAGAATAQTPLTCSKDGANVSLWSSISRWRRSFCALREPAAAARSTAAV